MGESRLRGMRDYWNDRARVNAAWYVDTSTNYDDPDMERFFADGRRIVTDALAKTPDLPEQRELAVEIGPGLGRICLALADSYERVVGIDISEEMVRRARELVTNPRVGFEIGNGASLRPVDDATADLVFSFTVFQHIPDPTVIEGYVAEVGRVLRPGGLFVFQWNNTPGALRWAVRRRVLALLQRTGLKRERFERHAEEFLGSRVPMPRMTAALRDAGMRIEATEGEGTLYAWIWAVKEG